MNDTSAVRLQHADRAQFTPLAIALGFHVAGPSDSGAFLVLDVDGRAWLFSGHAHSKFGRTILPSVWNPFNVGRMTAVAA